MVAGALAMAGLVCVTDGGRPRVVRTWLLESDVVAPVATGPRLADRPRPRGRPRSEDSLYRAIWTRESRLRACYDWARIKDPGLNARLTARLDVDPFGVTRVAVESEIAALKPLAGCVKDMLHGIRLRELVARRTRVVAPINFEHRYLDAPPRRKRPLGYAHRPPGNVCMELPDELPEDAIEIEPFEIDSKSPLRFRYSFKRDDLDEFREVVRWNSGAYSACFADAHARRPGLEGRITMGILIDAAGTVQRARVESSTVNDAPLRACITKAFAELWFPSSVTQEWLDGRVTLTFDPRAQAPREPAPATCGARVAALHKKYPWIDERTLTAARSCPAESIATLEKIVAATRHQGRFGSEPSEEALDAYRLLIAARPRASTAMELGDTLSRLGRHAEALPAFSVAAVAATDDDSARVAEDAFWNTLEELGVVAPWR